MGASLRTQIGSAASGSNGTYTASTNQGSAVSIIQVTNTTSNNATVGVTITISGTTKNLARDIVVPPGTAIGVLSGTLNLQSGSVITITTTNNIDWVVSGLDYSV